MTNINPCKCGSPARVSGGRSVEDGYVVIVGCDTCGHHCGGDSCSCWHTAEDSAIDTWNREVAESGDLPQLKES